METQHPPSSRTTLIELAIVALVAIVAHGWSLSSGWIWDDDSYVTANRVLSSPDGWAEVFIPGRTPQYYPLVFLGFWVQHAVSGIEPFMYHAVNVLMHAANAVLLYLIMRRLRVAGDIWIALVFAAHPMGVESVAWVTERKNVQSMLFALASVLAFLAHLDAPANRRAGSWIASFALFGCALLSKTTAIFVPPCLVMAALWQRRAIDRAFIARVAPFFLLGIALGLHTAHVEKTQVGAVGADFELAPLERLQLAPSIAMFYLRKFLAPLEQIFIYPRAEPDVASLLKWVHALLAAVLLWTCVSWWRKGSRGPMLLALWIGAGLFPALGFFDVWPFRYSFVADHFAYAAMPALALVLVACAHEVMSLLRVKEAVARTAVLAALCVAFVVLSVRATATYEDEETLWRTTAAQNPEAWIAHNNLSTIVLRRAEDFLRAGDADGARIAASEALALATIAGTLKPTEFTNAVNRSEAHRLLGMNAQALEEIDTAVGLAPGLSENHWMRARLLELLGRADEARSALLRAAELGNGGVDEFVARRDLMRLATARGDNADALVQCARAVEIGPGDTDMVANLGSLRATAGDAAQGRATLLRALAMHENGQPFANASAWFTCAARYLRLAASTTLEPSELREATIVASRLVARSNGDPAARYLEAALRLAHGDQGVRGFLEETEQGARSAGATALADEMRRFLDAHPPVK
ncbi:MAG: glycosyltransferase family 39 protein [Planctomycetota bacterium]